jgi:hypothetical protein
MLFYCLGTPAVVSLQLEFNQLIAMAANMVSTNVLCRCGTIKPGTQANY